MEATQNKMKKIKSFFLLLEDTDGLKAIKHVKKNKRLYSQVKNSETDSYKAIMDAKEELNLFPFNN